MSQPDIRERKRARTNEHMPPNGHVHDDDWFIGSIDQGTTSSRFIIFSSQADVVASHQIEFENHYPESGYVVSPSRRPLSPWPFHDLCTVQKRSHICQLTDGTNTNPWIY